MKTRLTHVRANVHDLDKAVEWYESVLGFECDCKDIHEQGGYAHFVSDGGAVFALATDENVPSHGRFNFDVDDVDALWKRLKGKAEIVNPVEIAHGTRYFSIKDLDGNVLGFCQRNCELK